MGIMRLVGRSLWGFVWVESDKQGMCENKAFGNGEIGVLLRV
jgi:hypothetical protein